jgi:hypothetical protein
MPHRSSCYDQLSTTSRSAERETDAANHGDLLSACRPKVSSASTFNQHFQRQFTVHRHVSAQLFRRAAPSTPALLPR